MPGMSLRQTQINRKIENNRKDRKKKRVNASLLEGRASKKCDIGETTRAQAMGGRIHTGLLPWASPDGITALRLQWGEVGGERLD